jgi:putative transposase
MKTVAEVIGVSRSNLADRLQERCKKRIGRPPLPDDELVSKIKAVIAELATYGYRRVHAVLKRQALHEGSRPAARSPRWRGRAPPWRPHCVDERNRRWCSDGFEIGCDNGERVPVAFALDCCDREAMSFLATTGGIAGEDVRDLMVAAVRESMNTRTDQVVADVQPIDLDDQEVQFGQVRRHPLGQPFSLRCTH